MNVEETEKMMMKIIDLTDFQKNRILDFVCSMLESENIPDIDTVTARLNLVVELCGVMNQVPRN